MNTSALANAEAWLSWITYARFIAAALVALGVVIEFGGNWVSKPFAKIVEAAREQQLAELRSEAARLSAAAETAKLENVRLQAAIQPRQIVIANRNGDEKVRAERFAAVKKHAGTKALIQAVPDFEAQMLAAAIQSALVHEGGWTVQIVNSVPPDAIREGVRIVTVEEALFAQPGQHSLAGNPLVSAAGRAAEAAAALLQLDLGPPYGPPLGGISWSPTVPIFAKAEFKADIPDGVVLILVGMKPVTSAFVWPVAPPKTAP